MIQKKDKNLLPPDLFSRNTVISQLVEMIFPDGGLKVLDVGGRGAGLSRFLSGTAGYTILDIAEKPADEECDYKQGDAQKIPFSDRNFDLVISTDMLEHVDKPFRAPAIREMLRVSKNYLILGIPCGNGLIAKAEAIVSGQYRDVTGAEHPFLNEHSFYGLPNEEKIEEVLNREKVQFFKVKEGNLMNWYIQQLYTGVMNGNDLEGARYEFNRFFNDNLFQLGNLRVPAYRTFFVIAKDGEVPEKDVLERLNASHVWNPEVFMDLLEKAFKDMRQVVDDNKTRLVSLEGSRRAEQNQFKALQTALAELRREYEDIHARGQRDARRVVEYEEKISELNGVLEKARESLNSYRSAIKEARAVLQEKEQAVNLLKRAVIEKDEIIKNFKLNESRLLELLRRETELNGELTRESAEKDVAILELKNKLGEAGSMLEAKEREISAKEKEMNVVRRDLENHRRELRSVVNSRAWKAVMAYTGVKKGFIGVAGKIVGPARRAVKNVLKGWNILIRLGPAVLIRRIKKKIKKNPVPGEGLTPYDLYLEKSRIESAGKGVAQKEMEKFSYKPVISVVMPVYNVHEKWLKKAIESVRGQWYERWELCVCNDASTDGEGNGERIKDVLNHYAGLDKRIKVVHRQHNGGIVKATNDALKLAGGAYVAFLDHDDELAADALFEVVKSAQATRPDLIYTDEDKIDGAGARCEPFFKPAWSPDLLLSHNYICHLAVYRRKILEEIGRLREGFEGSQDYDLLLRFTEKTQNIRHIPRVLYHWRKIPGSAAAEVEAKPYAFESAQKALAQAIKRRGIKGEVVDGLWKGSYRVKREIAGEPLVSIIIPFRDQLQVLKKCLSSILEKTSYGKFEILLVDNMSTAPETQKYLQTLTDDKVRVFSYEGKFNFSAINNFSALRAKGEFLVLLNNDTEVISPDWIEAMLEHAQRKEVGAVGAKLLYPDNLVQHAGVLIGVGGIANSSFLKGDGNEHGYFGQANVIRNYSAVTGACMMVRKEVYDEAGGLNEKNLAVTFNDVDFCLRLRQKGYLIVYTPYARLYHYESLSRGYEVDLVEVGYMQREHRAILGGGDPYYNPNLTRERFDFSLRVTDKTP